MPHKIAFHRRCACQAGAHAILHLYGDVVPFLLTGCLHRFLLPPCESRIIWVRQDQASRVSREAQASVNAANRQLASLPLWSVLQALLVQASRVCGELTADE